MWNYSAIGKQCYKCLLIGVSNPPENFHDFVRHRIFTFNLGTPRGAPNGLTTSVLRRRGSDWDLPQHPLPPRRHHGVGSPQGVITWDNQEYLGCLQAKPCAGREIIHGEGANRSHMKPLPGWIHRRHRSTGTVAGREGKGLGGINLDAGGGGVQSPAGRLHRPTEVLPIGVGLSAVRHTGTRGGIQTGRKVTLGVITSVYLPWGGRAHDQPENCGIPSQECGDSNTGSDTYRKR